jgi:hypothetical protein
MRTLVRIGSAVIAIGAIACSGENSNTPDGSTPGDASSGVDVLDGSTPRDASSRVDALDGSMSRDASSRVDALDGSTPRDASSQVDALDGSADAAMADASDAASSPPIVSFPDTYDGIHAFLTFDDSVTDIPTAAQHDDFVWGAYASNIAAYRASAHPQIVLSAYIPFTRDNDGSHTLGYWQSAHPDWVLYQCDQQTPAYEFGDPNVSLDITNPAVVDWQVQEFAVPAAAAGYDAIAADNFTLTNVFGACGIFENGTWKALYTGNADPQYTSDVLAWAKSFAGKLHALTPKPLGLIPNFSLGQAPTTDPNTAVLVSYVDAILDEGSFTQYGSGYPSETDWNSLQNSIEYLQTHGKAYYAINEVNVTPPVSNDMAQWSIASYLMSKEHASGIFISGVQQYGYDLYRPEYGLAIGTPCGAMQKTQGVYTREYKHGLAIVNPTTNAVTFTLPTGTWQDSFGNSVGASVQMAVDTGLVLLDTAGPHC